MAHCAGQSVLLDQRLQPRVGHTSSAAASLSRSTTIRVSNPSSNPALFETLGKKLVSTNTTSSSWSAIFATRKPTSEPTERNESNATDERNFAHANVRRVPAEMLPRLRGAGNRRHTTSLAACQWARGQCRFPMAATRTTSSPPSAAPRATRCVPASRRPIPTLSQALHMLTAARSAARSNRANCPRSCSTRRRKTPAGDHRVDLHPRSVPQAERGRNEESAGSRSLRRRTHNKAWDDVFWAVLNSREFLFNH